MLLLLLLSFGAVAATKCFMPRINKAKHKFMTQLNANTHMPILIQLIVGQLQLVEGHNLLHPIGAGRRRIGMDMYSRRRYGICFASDHPAGAAEDTDGVEDVMR